MLRSLSNDDVIVRDTATPWMEVLKMMDERVVRFCNSNGINDYMPYRIRALTVSTPSRGPKEESCSTLERLDPSRWQGVLDLVPLNHSISMKDIYITIDSTWTIEGREPPELELELELELG